MRVLLSFGCELPVCFSQFLQHNLSDDFWLFVILGNVCVPSSFELQRRSFSSLKQIALSGVGVMVPGWDNDATSVMRQLKVQLGDTASSCCFSELNPVSFSGGG